MPPRKQSDIFKFNFVSWKFFGIWPGRSESKIYRYYSYLYLIATLFIYNILLTLNLAYTPRKIEFIIREVIFYFTEIAVTSKVFMIIAKRDKIIEALNLLDSKTMGADDEEGQKTMDIYHAMYRTCWKILVVWSNIAYSCQVIPLFLYWVIKSGVNLPICNYYFLTDALRQDYFGFWFIYQSVGMYGHMMYNVSIDSFIAGLLLMAIVQCRVLNDKFFNLSLRTDETQLNFQAQELIMMARLRECLVRFEFLLKYCEVVQEILSETMFVVFGITSVIICVVLCGLLQPSSTETYVFFVLYLLAMTIQIFMPGYLGTQSSYESTRLVSAAYNTEWVQRSESFKRSIRIFVERANIPIQMSGLKMFPLSLTTFTSIMKSAYSFFTLIRNFQDK